MTHSLFVVQASVLETCIAVTQNPALFQSYSRAAAEISEYFEGPVPGVSSFVSAVQDIQSALSCVDNQQVLTLATMQQLTHLATALPMIGFSDVGVNVQLIDIRSQTEECYGFLAFMTSDYASRLPPVAQLAADLQQVRDAPEQVTCHEVEQLLHRCKQLVVRNAHMALLSHFAASQSALYNAYLQHSWQHHMGLLTQGQGKNTCTCQCWIKWQLVAYAEGCCTTSKIHVVPCGCFSHDAKHVVNHMLPSLVPADWPFYYIEKMAM